MRPSRASMRGDVRWLGCRRQLRRWWWQRGRSGWPAQARVGCVREVRGWVWRVRAVRCWEDTREEILGDCERRSWDHSWEEMGGDLGRSWEILGDLGHLLSEGSLEPGDLRLKRFESASDNLPRGTNGWTRQHGMMTRGGMQRFESGGAHLVGLGGVADELRALSKLRRAARRPNSNS